MNRITGYLISSATVFLISDPGAKTRYEPIERLASQNRADRQHSGETGDITCTTGHPQLHN